MVWNRNRMEDRQEIDIAADMAPLLPSTSLHVYQSRIPYMPMIVQENVTPSSHSPFLANIIHTRCKPPTIARVSFPRPQSLATHQSPTSPHNPHRPIPPGLHLRPPRSRHSDSLSERIPHSSFPRPTSRVYRSSQRRPNNLPWTRPTNRISHHRSQTPRSLPTLLCPTIGEYSHRCPGKVRSQRTNDRKPWSLDPRPRKENLRGWSAFETKCDESWDWFECY